MLDEITIITGLKARSEATIKSIYDSNKAKAYSILLKNGATQEECNTIFNDSVITLVDNICRDKFKGSSKLDTYLLGIVKLKWYKTLKTRNTGFVEFKKEIGDFDLEDSLEYDDLKDELIDKAAIKMKLLDDACRTLLLKFYYEGTRLSVIAEQMELSSGFVRIKKGRCLKRLKSLIEE